MISLCPPAPCVNHDKIRWRFIVCELLGSNDASPSRLGRKDEWFVTRHAQAHRCDSSSLRETSLGLAIVVMDLRHPSVALRSGVLLQSRTTQTLGNFLQPRHRSNGLENCRRRPAENWFLQRPGTSACWGELSSPLPFFEVGISAYGV